MPLKNWCSIHTRCSKSSLKHSISFCGIFPSLKHNSIVYRSSKVSSRLDCIFEIHHLWQSGSSRVYSICCCSCSFEAETIKIGQSSHKMYSNNIVNFQESTTILNACTKKSGNLLNAPHNTFSEYLIRFRLWYYYVWYISDGSHHLFRVLRRKNGFNSLFSNPWLLRLSYFVSII